MTDTEDAAIGRQLQALLDFLRHRKEKGFRGVLSLHVGDTAIEATVAWEPETGDVGLSHADLNRLLYRLLQDTKTAGPKLTESKGFRRQMATEARKIVGRMQRRS